ncbi:DegV family protein [Metamycoplasma hominis]|uniref:DegV family protein n=1 Tax=Metamycoplasma hominis TaxID=2098 RepID=UPI0005CA8F3B|nr:DegV family protein [Metamycoplasma hominis]
MKIKIIIDSSAGMSQEQANSFGWDLIPIQIEVGNDIYKSGIDFDTDKFEELWRNDKKIDAKTFATPPGIAMQVIEKYFNDYDKILVYPISNALSSQCASLTAQFASNPKVHVVQSNKISYLIVRDLLMFEEYIKEGKSFDEAIEHFKNNNERLLLIPEFNDALLKGGRLSKAAAAIAKLLKIVPIIKFDNGILEKDGIGRIFKKTLEKNLKELYENTNKDNENNYLLVVNANNDKIDELIQSFKQITNDFPRIYTIQLSCDIVVHAGIGAICLTFAEVSPKIKDKFFLYLKKQ